METMTVATDNPADSDPGYVLRRKVGAYLRRHRDELGLSQQAVADRMQDAGYDWHKDTVRRLEHGVGRDVGVAELPALARALRFDPAALLAAMAEDTPPPARPAGRGGRQRVGAFPPTLTPGLATRGQSERIEGFVIWEGQLASLDALASDLGISRAEAARSTIELGLEDYEEVAKAGDPEEMLETLEASRQGARERAGGTP